MDDNNIGLIEENLNINKELNSNQNNSINTQDTTNNENKKESISNNYNIEDKNEEKKEENTEENNGTKSEEKQEGKKEEKTHNDEDIKKNEQKQKGLPKTNKKNYKEIVKEFINQSGLDTRYDEQIKTNPLSLFDTIDEQKIKSWETNLYKISPNTRKITNAREEDILSDLIELKEQIVIKNDCKRTRVRESILYPNFVVILEKILVYYCKMFEVTYKQGLNEIFGPLVLMRYKLKNYSLLSIIHLGARLIDVFLPNYFYEKEIYSLKSALGLYIILLKYHEPTVYNKLDKLEIRPEIYATNWLVNYISGKMNLCFFYELWDQMINIKDPLFIQFMLVAIIKNNREIIINCDENFVAPIMTSLTIKSKDELMAIIKTAMELREKTPYSFRILANKIGFLRKNYNKIKDKYEEYQPQILPAMPIFPSEVLFITFKNEIDCIDSKCINYIKNLEKASPDIQLRVRNPKKRYESKTVREKKRVYDIDSLTLLDKNHLCEKCDMKIKKNMQYILLDLRILQYENEDDSAKTGFLPMMINVSQKELKSEDFSNIMINRFITERGNYHFIFLTSTTDTFSIFENNLYLENISEEDKRKMIFGIIKQQKIDKELNINIAKTHLPIKYVYKLKEYDNMRITLNSMIKHNFPYIGYVYGGFKLVHKESKRFKVDLLFHNKETCLLCNQNTKSRKSYEFGKIEEEKENKNELYQSLWEHKTKIKYKNLDIFFKNPNNQMHLCVLKEYKNKNIEKEQIQILINELFDKFEIEIYKFDKQKQSIDFENTIQIMDKKKKQEYYDLGKDDNDEDTNMDLELTLLEKVSAIDIISIKPNENTKNIVNVSIRDEDKNKMLGLIKKKESNSITHNIVFDFSSDKDSKNFIHSFKSLINLYRENRDKNKK